MHERWVKGGSRIGEFEAYMRGGQEACLRDTMPRGSDELAEKTRGLQVGERNGKTKSVSISDEKVNEGKVPEERTKLSDEKESKESKDVVEPVSTEASAVTAK